ncbi:MAG: GTP 3',8-cyclase MoaA [Ectothiorhodospira sp.]
MPEHTAPSPTLQDPFGRQITYLRLSITDRCDLRCGYCMDEGTRFLRRQQILTLEEIHTVAEAFVALGVDKIRVTGGEPLVRRGGLDLLRALGRLDGLRELVLTTNGTRLDRHAPALRGAGVRRVNISLDSLRPERFRRITRNGRLEQVLAGIEAARRAGFEGLRLNCVIQRGVNEDEVPELVAFARDRGMDIAFIEQMPLGGGRSPSTGPVTCDEVRARVERYFPMIPTLRENGGPARYFRLADGPTRVGFIAPMSHDFCAACNRIRLTADGRLLPCLGQSGAVDLKGVLRARPGDRQALEAAIARALRHKPRAHGFHGSGEPLILHRMNQAGG